MQTAASLPDIAPPRTTDRLKLVRAWLWLVVVLVAAMVVVGGATRLTGSGLSITEWRPVTGAIPPLSAEAWEGEFAKYRASPQYELMNKGMSLGEFQFIYWWEWGHRQLGRFIGLAFAAGFLFFSLTRRVDTRTAVLLFLMGLLLGTQGAVGWIMVASGLKPGMTAVAPVKLTLHLGLALLFFSSLLAMLVRLRGFAVERPAAPRAVGAGAWAVVVMCFVQILLGGLVAGSRAGFAFNTWPLMDGGLAPGFDTLFAVTPWFENFVDNVALVQLNHRLGAYALLAMALWHAWQARRLAPGTAAARRAMILAGLVIAQAALGVATLLYVVPLDLGLAHQFGAVIVLGVGVVHVAVDVAGRRKVPAPALKVVPSSAPA